MYAFLFLITFLDLLFVTVYSVILLLSLPVYICTEFPNIYLINVVTFILLRIYSFNYPKDSLQVVWNQLWQKDPSISYTSYYTWIAEFILLTTVKITFQLGKVIREYLKINTLSRKEKMFTAQVNQTELYIRVKCFNIVYKFRTIKEKSIIKNRLHQSLIHSF